VLAILLLHPNQPVSAQRIAADLWGEDEPADATRTVQVYVSRLRRALGDPEAIATTPAGYRLRVRPQELDAERLERGLEAGRRALGAGMPQDAAVLLDEALALWRGPPLAELEFEAFARAEIAQLAEQRLAALDARIDADLAAGRHAALIGELQPLPAEHPTRERFVALMLAIDGARPYDLRHAFASLLIHESRLSVVDAAQTTAFARRSEAPADSAAASSSAEARRLERTTSWTRCVGPMNETGAETSGAGRPSWSRLARRSS
jgi:DNA-binding SARP family transcriptional activator